MPKSARVRDDSRVPWHVAQAPQIVRASGYPSVEANHVRVQNPQC